MNVLEVFRRKGSSLKAQLTALMLGMVASFYGFAAMASTTPVDEVKAAINSGKADAIAIAVVVVITLWAIWSVYLMRRKG